MKSIMQNYEEECYCYICGSTDWLQSHHCIGGTSNRANSEKHGLKVLLCMNHHTGAQGVHANNFELQQKLHEAAQRKFEEKHTREEFRKIFGVSFL